MLEAIDAIQDAAPNLDKDISEYIQREEKQEELVCKIMQQIHVQNGMCSPSFDRVLCWPETPPDTLAVLPCFEELNGIFYDTTQNATRWCLPNASWDQYSDYSSCKELLQFDSMEVDITTNIYFVGYTLSLMALTVAVYIFWRFKDLRCLRNTIHMNLMCSYILADLTWIIIYTSQVVLHNSMAMCVLFIVLLHYFHLTNFFWMFVEGLYLYILVAKTFTGECIKLYMYVTLGWGGPFFFIFIWGIARSFTIPMEHELEHFEMALRTCPWTPHVYDWIFQAPAIAVLMINVIFLCVIMWVLITKLQSANNVETQQYRKAAKALLVLIPLLGITYVLVIVGPTDGIYKNIYDYLRAALLSTQGLNVALFYCFLNTEVKNTVIHHFSSWHTRRTLGSRRQRGSSSSSFRDWSAQARDSLRLYYPRKITKRGSASDTTTVVVVPFPKTVIQKNGPELSAEAG